MWVWIAFNRTKTVSFDGIF